MKKKIMLAAILFSVTSASASASLLDQAKQMFGFGPSDSSETSAQKEVKNLAIKTRLNGYVRGGNFESFLQETTPFGAMKLAFELGNNPAYSSNKRSKYRAEYKDLNVTMGAIHNAISSAKTYDEFMVFIQRYIHMIPNCVHCQQWLDSHTTELQVLFKNKTLFHRHIDIFADWRRDENKKYHISPHEWAAN